MLQIIKHFTGMVSVLLVLGVAPALVHAEQRT